VLAIVDTGPLVAAFNRGDPLHQLAADLLRRPDLEFVVPTLCLGEASYLIERDLGPSDEARFLRACADLDLRAPEGSHLRRMADLVEQFADFPLGTVDAFVVALAEELQTPLVATFDHRHFRAIRPAHVPAFTLLP
jgi:predicted nucleic acid-binding protein